MLCVMGNSFCFSPNELSLSEGNVLLVKAKFVEDFRIQSTSKNIFFFHSLRQMGFFGANELISLVSAVNKLLWRICFVAY